MEKLQKNQRIASLDIHSPLYLRTEEDLYGAGDIGSLHQLIDKASDAGFSMIQLNPIQDTGLNPCPYLGKSIFSYNPIFLDVEKLPENDTIRKIKKDYLDRASERLSPLVDYRRLYKFKESILRAHCESTCENSRINTFDFDRPVLAYALFCTLQRKFQTVWTNWPVEFRGGDVESILKNHPDLLIDLTLVLFSQNILASQWQELEKYAHGKGILIALDKPIYPIHDSADVWANQNLFYLRNDGSLRYGSGCNNPKDPFGPQYWGHAVYKFKEHPEKVMSFIFESIGFMSTVSKVIRLDHALALVWKYYVANPKTKTGRHYPALKHRFLKNLVAKFPDVYFIAEDIGYSNKNLIDKPLAQYSIPGMRCPQWFDKIRYSKVNNYPKSCLAFTSNHDTISLVQWWHLLKKSRRRIFLSQIEDQNAKDDEIVWELTKLVFDCPANIASITLRDLSFDLKRYNHAGTKKSQNWRTRMPLVLEKVDFSKIKKIIETSRRIKQ